MPRQFLAMVVAEVRKVFTRASGIAALVVAVLVPLVTVGIFCLIRWGVPMMLAEEVREDFADQVPFTAVMVLDWTLWARNFFVLPLCLLLAAASSVAGEFSARTLRELSVRPVPRWSVLGAKGLAMVVLSAATLVLTLLPALGLGLSLFGLPEEGAVPSDAPTVSGLLLGYLATLLSDVMLFAIAFLVSLLIRSVGGVVVAMVFLLMLDFGFGMVLGIVPTAAQMLDAPQLQEAAEAVRPWTLRAALSCWEGYEDGWDRWAFVALLTWSALASLAAVVRFNRMDVP